MADSKTRKTASSGSQTPGAGNEVATSSRTENDGSSETLTWWQLTSLRLTMLTRRSKSPRSAERRRAAIERVVAANDRRVVPLLIEALNDPWVVVREAAARGLGKLKASEALPRLLELVAEDQNADVRRAAGWALGAIGDARCIEALLKLGAEQARFRVHVIEIVSRFGRAAVPTLINALQRASLTVRIDAASTLGRIQDPAALKPLLATLSAPEPMLRARAAEAIGQLGDARAVPHLLPLLRDPEPEVSLAALQTLSQMSDEKSVPHLLPFLQHAQPECRGLAAAAIGRCGDDAAAAALMPLVTDPDVTVRQRAVESLGNLQWPGAVAGLMVALDDLNPGVRRRAAEALGELRDVAALPALTEKLLDDSSEVRRASAGALGSLGQNSAVPALSQLVVNELVSEVRLAGIRSLGEIGDKAGLTALKELLEDDVGIRCRACVAIAQIGTPRAVELLSQAIRDPHPEVRYHAVVGLGNIGDALSLKALGDMADESDAFVLRGLAKSLRQFNDPRATALLFRTQQNLTRAEAANSSGNKPSGRVKSGGATGKAPEPSEGDSGVFANRRLVFAAAGAVTVALFALGWWSLMSPARSPAVSRGAQLPSQAVRKRGAVVGVGFHTEREAVAVSSTGRVELWDLSTGQLSREVLQLPNGAQGASVSPDGDRVAVSGPTGIIHVVSLKTGGEVAQLPGHRGTVRLLQFSADGERLCSAGFDRQIIVWNIAERTAAWRLTIDGSDPASAFGIDRDLNRVAYGLGAGQVFVVDVEQNRKIGPIRGFDSTVSALQFSDDGRLLAGGNLRGEIRIWDLQARQTRYSFEKSGGLIQMLRFSPDARKLFAAKSSVVEVWDLGSETPQQLVAEVSSGRGSSSLDQLDFLAVDRSARYLLACSQSSSEIACWNLAEGSSLRVLVPK